MLPLGEWLYKLRIRARSSVGDIAGTLRVTAHDEVLALEPRE